VKNKVRRQEFARILKTEKKKLKQKRRDLAKDSDEPKQIPKTLESMRIHDITTVAAGDEEVLGDEGLLPDDVVETKEEVEGKQENEVLPKKVLIAVAGPPSRRTRMFCRQLASSIPNCEFKWRPGISLKFTSSKLTQLGYSAFITVTESREEPTSLLISQLPDGPTAKFRVSNVKLVGELRGMSRNVASRCAPPKRHRAAAAPLPVIVANNFSTRLGLRISNLLQSLFPEVKTEPDSPVEGGRVLTFHNQRDYIFIRQHMFTVDESRSKRIRLKEVGPRFTLKLRSLQPTTFDCRHGEFEWVLKRHEMETSRRKFFL